MGPSNKSMRLFFKKCCPWYFFSKTVKICKNMWKIQNQRYVANLLNKNLQKYFDFIKKYNMNVYDSVKNVFLSINHKKPRKVSNSKIIGCIKKTFSLRTPLSSLNFQCNPSIPYFRDHKLSKNIVKDSYGGGGGCCTKGLSDPQTNWSLICMGSILPYKVGCLYSVTE